MWIPFTQDELDCVADMQSRLVKWDRVRCYACPWTARTFTFDRWDHKWMESKTCKSFFPTEVISINKIPYRHKWSNPDNYK